MTWDVFDGHSMTNDLGFPKWLKLISLSEFHWINRNLFTLVSLSKISEPWALHSRAGISPHLVWRSELSSAIHPSIQLGSYSTCTLDWAFQLLVLHVATIRQIPDAKLLAWSNSAWTWCYRYGSTPKAEELMTPHDSRIPIRGPFGFVRFFFSR